MAPDRSEIMRAVLDADGAMHLPGDTDAELLDRMRCSWQCWPGASLEVQLAVSGVTCFCRIRGEVVAQGKSGRDPADAEMWALKRALEIQREREHRDEQG